MALTEWGLTPAYLNAEWTDELLQLMLEKRVVRLGRRYRPTSDDGLARRVSNSEFFARHGIKVTHA